MATTLYENTENRVYGNEVRDNISFRQPENRLEILSESNETERMKEIYDNLLYLFDKKKIYLEPHITLSKLSLLLCTNTSYLSKTINRFFRCNLKSLLNRYRIGYAKELLKKKECDIRTLPERCGFLSRSTFYAAFARHGQTTPTDFRAHFQSVLLKKGEEIE